MLFNSQHPDCKSLTIEAVNTETPQFLHRMEWADDDKIGSIPLDYNYLVGYYDYIEEPKALHFTDGGPWHKETVDVEYAQEWLAYLTKEERADFEKGLFWES